MSLRDKKVRDKEKAYHKADITAKFKKAFPEISIGKGKNNDNEIKALQETIEVKDKDIVELNAIIDDQHKTLGNLDSEITRLADNNNKLVNEIAGFNKEKAALIKTYEAESEKGKRQVAKYKKEISTIKEKLKLL